MNGTCRICKTDNVDLFHHSNIYAFGSEGINICHTCNVALSEFVRQMSYTAARAYKQAFKKYKQP